jgi:hypothetical protein
MTYNKLKNKAFTLFNNFDLKQIIFILTNNQIEKHYHENIQN